MRIHSFFNEIIEFPKIDNNMKNIISKIKKREYVHFIKSNFNNLSQREIARRLNLGKTTVNRWAEETGLKFKKHTVNEKFFNEFNEKSSYILGLIFSDGNISWDPQKGYYSMTITASEKDKDHLENIRNILLSSKSLLYSSKTKSYRLIVNSKELCQKLMQLGLTPRKSLTMKFPKIPKNYLRHFIRGIIDGDGSVFYRDRKVSPYFCIRISSGSKKFLQELVKTIKENININGNIRKIDKNVHLVEYSCSRGKKLAKYIYFDANIFLERKYLPYKNNILEVEKDEER